MIFDQLLDHTMHKMLHCNYYAKYTTLFKSRVYRLYKLKKNMYPNNTLQFPGWLCMSAIPSVALKVWQC